MFFYLLIAYLLIAALIRCMIVMLSTRNLCYRGNKAILVFHCPFGICKSKLRCQPGPSRTNLCLLLEDPSRAFLMVLHSSAL